MFLNGKRTWSAFPERNIAVKEVEASRMLNDLSRKVVGSQF